MLEPRGRRTGNKQSDGAEVHCRSERARPGAVREAELVLELVHGGVKVKVKVSQIYLSNAPTKVQ